MKPGDRVRIPDSCFGTIHRISGNTASVHWDDDAWSTLLLVELRPVETESVDAVAPPLGVE